MAPPASLLHDAHATTFGGIRCAQAGVDFFTWEWVLNAEVEGRGITRIIELGTWQGGFSFWLDAQCRARGLDFHTFDVLNHDGDYSVPGFRRLDIFAKADLLRDEIRDPSGSLELAAGRLILYCDNGNKPRELREFAHACSPGSLVAVHDWKTEVFPDDVPDCLTEIHADYLDAMGSMTRWFERAT